MDLPTLISRMSLYSILVVFCDFCPFFLILIEHFVSKQWRPDQILHSASSDQVLQCLPMSHKMDDRLMWVNIDLLHE